jgi:hypothetical protein
VAAAPRGAALKNGRRIWVAKWCIAAYQVLAKRAASAVAHARLGAVSFQFKARRNGGLDRQE